MTDRISHLTVMLTEPMRDDEVQPLIEAIKQMRNVLYVQSGKDDPMQGIAERRVRRDLHEKIFALLQGED